MGADHVREFLNYLAQKRKVSASTQNQTFNALIFLYKQAVSMTKCKKHSMMPSEIKSVRSEQFCGASEPQRLAWSGVEFPGNRVQRFLRMFAQVALLWQVAAAIRWCFRCALAARGYADRRSRPSPRWQLSTVDAPPFPGPGRKSETDAFALRSDSTRGLLRQPELQAEGDPG